MERKKKIHYRFGVYKSFPLFIWQECCMCHKEFRRERLWHTLTGPFCGQSGTMRYLCTKCAPTEDRAHEIFHYNEWHKMRKPNIPPPPPRPRRIREGVKIDKGEGK